MSYKKYGKKYIIGLGKKNYIISFPAKGGKIRTQKLRVWCGLWCEAYFFDNGTDNADIMEKVRNYWFFACVGLSKDENDFNEIILFIRWRNQFIERRVQCAHNLQETPCQPSMRIMPYNSIKVSSLGPY